MASIFGTKGTPWNDQEPGANDAGVVTRQITGSKPGGLPSGATFVGAASGNVANAQAQASLPAVAAKLNYLTGVQITAAGATGALVVNATIAGLVGGTVTYSFAFPAGVAVQATPIIVPFPMPIPASAVNTAIVVTLPAGGAGNTNAAVALQGYVV